MLGQQHTAVWNVSYVLIWSFGCDIVSFGGVESIFCVAERLLCNDLGNEDHSKSKNWVRMTLERKYVSGSVCIVPLFIENEVID